MGLVSEVKNLVFGFSGVGEDANIGESIVRTTVSSISGTASVVPATVNVICGTASVVRAMLSSISGTVSVVRAAVSAIRGTVSVVRATVSALCGDVSKAKVVKMVLNKLGIDSSAGTPQIISKRIVTPPDETYGMKQEG